MMELAEPVVLQRHRITVDEYYRMAETGILGPESRVELIEGEIIDMAAIGTRHYATVNRLNRLLFRAVGDSAIVSVQNPLRLGRYDEPQPDLVLLKPRADDYICVPYTAEDTLLVVEVADSSIAYDMKLKARLYASRGVAHYWVADVANSRLIVHAQPSTEGFMSVQTLTELGMIDLPGLDGLQADLSSLF
jgi:Uma2 family endonuclease